VTPADTATLLLPGVLTALLYVAVLFFFVTRRRTAAGPPLSRGPTLPRATPRPRPPLRLVAGGRVREAAPPGRGPGAG
jgi:hypothetical protein